MTKTCTMVNIRFCNSGVCGKPATHLVEGDPACTEHADACRKDNLDVEPIADEYTACRNFDPWDGPDDEDSVYRNLCMVCGLEEVHHKREAQS